MIKALNPVKNRALSDDVLETIRHAIFSGKLRPGDSLREMQLAKELSVSQATVREALSKLERYGLVVRVPNKETIVTRHSRKSVIERVTLRAHLEELAMNEAIKRLTPEAIKTLEAKLVRLSAAVMTNDYFETSQLDLDFHRFIWQQADNVTLYEMLDQLTTPLFAFISVLRSESDQRLADVVSPHDKLLSILREGREPDIKEAVREHVFDSYQSFFDSGAESLEEMLSARS